MILEPVNQAIVTTAATAVTLPAGIDCEDYLVQAEGAVAVKISNVEALTTYYTIKANAQISLNEILGPGAQVFWALSVTSDTTLQLLPLPRHRGN